MPALLPRCRHCGIELPNPFWCVGSGDGAHYPADRLASTLISASIYNEKAIVANVYKNQADEIARLGARVQALLAANSAEVEKRRAAEQDARRVRRLLERAIAMMDDSE